MLVTEREEAAVIMIRYTHMHELIEMRDYRKLNTLDSSSLISSLFFNITHRITVTRLNILYYNIMYIHVYTYYVRNTPHTHVHVQKRRLD